MKLMFSKEGLRVILVSPKDPEDKERCREFYRLRDRVFGEKYHWEEPCGEERDRFDDASVFVLARWNEKMVAGCRIIYRERSISGLPIEAYLSPDCVPVPHAVELSRMINTSGESEIAWSVYGMLYRHLVISERVEEMYAVIREKYLTTLETRLRSVKFERLPGRVKLVGHELFIPVKLVSR